MKVDKLKELLREHNLPTTGQKAELVQRLIEQCGSDEMESDDETLDLQHQISELQNAMKNIVTMMQQNVVQVAQNNEPPPRNVESPTRSEQAGSEVCNVQYSCSVKEIAETIPCFDPSNESMLSVEQFIVRA